MISDAEILEIRRPHRNLLTYYAITSLLLGPFFFVVLIPLYFRYHTMKYGFDREGLSMSWGVLFHREISLTYSRIQDIHLTSNLLERWLGLARIQIQTASGSSNAEMTIEGILEYERVRDFLYSRMRGVGPRAEKAESGASGSEPNLAAILTDIASELRQIRASISRGTNHVE
jgi:membrane protein YdbS with pleckstrin-like domain